MQEKVLLLTLLSLLIAVAVVGYICYQYFYTKEKSAKSVVEGSTAAGKEGEKEDGNGGGGTTKEKGGEGGTEEEAGGGNGLGTQTPGEEEKEEEECEPFVELSPPPPPSPPPSPLSSHSPELYTIPDERKKEIIKEEINRIVSEAALKNKVDDMFVHKDVYDLERVIVQEIDVNASFTQAKTDISNRLDGAFNTIAVPSSISSKAKSLIREKFYSAVPMINSYTFGVDIEAYSRGDEYNLTPEDSNIGDTFPVYVTASMNKVGSVEALLVREDLDGLHIFFNRTDKGVEDIGSRGAVISDNQVIFTLTFNNKLGYDVVMIRDFRVDRVCAFRSSDRKVKDGDMTEDDLYDEKDTPYFIPNGDIRTLYINGSYSQDRHNNFNFNKLYFTFLFVSCDSSTTKK
nr:MAG: hypothetical protein [Hemigrapsus takanoi nimavirus]